VRFHFSGKSLSFRNADSPTIQAKHSEMVGKLWRRYLQSRQSNYAKEGRWPDKKFWSRRAVEPDHPAKNADDSSGSSGLPDAWHNEFLSRQTS
jgi:hypothetical protein